MNYLLDTNICIYLIKGKPQAVIDKLISLGSVQIFISAITLAELKYGVKKSSQPEKNQEALKNFLTPFTVVAFDEPASVEYGIVRGNLESKGTPIGPLDSLIAAHAKSLNITLVTNNSREFGRVEGLSIENWVN